MHGSALSLLLPLAMSAALASDTVDPDAIDWAPIGQETAELLSRYLQVDTVNPPGNELEGARFLADWLAAQGIASVIQEYTPGRANIWARVEGSTDAAPICLLSHIDVVPAEADRWEVPPFSGHIDEAGFVWGRGALDMKGMGAIEAMTLALLHRLKVPLDRDVIFLAVADEEVDNTGIRAAIERWDELGCSHVINEGGMGVDGLLFERQVLFPISVGEKGYLWGEVVATGAPGHGSTPVADNAPERLMHAYAVLADRRVRPTWDPLLLEFLSNVGEHRGGMPGFIMQRPSLVRLLLTRQLMQNPIIRATLINTAYITGFSGALEPNVVPAEVRANLDSRLLPGTSPDQMQRYLNDLLDAAGVEGVEVVSLSGRSGSVSPTADPLYQALATRAVQQMPEAVAGPVLSPGFTDSIYLRELGVRAYGLVPFVVDEAGLRSMHGDNEGVHTHNLERGVRVLFSAVVDVASSSPTPP